MVLQGQQPADKKLDDLFGGGEFWENVDWSRTRAYAMGIGQIYFNLRGRESRGIVSPGAEATQLADELSAKLLTMTDPEDGSRRSSALSTSATTSIPASTLNNASELQVGMHEGYRVSWQTTLGGSPRGNRVSEHEEVERAITAGTISRRRRGCSSPTAGWRRRHRRSWTSRRRC